MDKDNNCLIGIELFQGKHKALRVGEKFFGVVHAHLPELRIEKFIVKGSKYIILLSHLNFYRKVRRCRAIHIKREGGTVECHAVFDLIFSYMYGRVQCLSD